jgi:hypothetical protein
MAAQVEPGKPGGVVFSTGVGRKAPPPPNGGEGAEVPAHATPEARAERMARAATLAAAVRAEETAEVTAADPFAVLDSPPPPPPLTAEAALAPPEKDVPVEPVEDLDSVVLKLPNGREVEYGLRRGDSHALALARIFQGRATAAVLAQNVVEYLFNVRSIDGDPVTDIVGKDGIRDLSHAKKLLDLIDDDGMNHLMFAHQKFWPAANDDRLQILKKNARA